MANATGHVPMSTVQWGDAKIKRPTGTSATTFYPGVMIALDSSGNVAHCDDTTGIRFDGIYCSLDPLIVASGDAAGKQKMSVERPWRFSMSIASAVAGDEGKALYAVDDNHVGYTSGNSIFVGWVDQVLSATSVLVRPAWSGATVGGVVGFDGSTLAYTGASAANHINIPDNLADALTVQQGSNAYLTFVTTDGSELTVVKGVPATAVTNVGGGVQVTAGIGGATSGAGGTVAVAGGAGTAGNSAGGAVSCVGGAGQGSAAGGANTNTGGAGGATGVGGACGVTGGAGGATSGTGGAATVTGGAGTNGNAVGGAATVTAGAGQGTGAGAVASVVGGGSGAGANGNGGLAKIVGGAALSTNGTGGAAQVTGGVATGTGTGGAVTIAAGASAGASGTAGSVTINSGAATGGTAGTVTVQSSVALPAAGSTQCGLLFSSTANLGVFFGSGAPTFSAAQGSLYMRSDGSSTSTRAYVNSTGSTIWVAITTAS